MGKIQLFTVVLALLCISVYCNETTDFLKGTSKDYISPVSEFQSSAMPFMTKCSEFSKSNLFNTDFSNWNQHSMKQRKWSKQPVNQSGKFQTRLCLKRWKLKILQLIKISRQTNSLVLFSKFFMLIFWHFLAFVIQCFLHCILEMIGIVSYTEKKLSYFQMNSSLHFSQRNKNELFLSKI